MYIHLTGLHNVNLKLRNHLSEYLGIFQKESISLAEATSKLAPSSLSTLKMEGSACPPENPAPSSDNVPEIPPNSAPNTTPDPISQVSAPVQMASASEIALAIASTATPLNLGAGVGLPTVYADNVPSSTPVPTDLSAPHEVSSTPPAPQVVTSPPVAVSHAFVAAERGATYQQLTVLETTNASTLPVTGANLYWATHTTSPTL